MFKTHLDGLVHQEQIRDYIRAVERNPTPRTRTKARRNLTVAVILASVAMLAWGVANFTLVAAFLQMVK